MSLSTTDPRTPLAAGDELIVIAETDRAFAIKFMLSAQEAIHRNDIPARKIGLSKALAIISELQSTLNMDQGGEIAANLDELYRWSSVRLLDATVHNDPVAIDDVLKVFRTLREGWSDIASGRGSGGK